MPEVGGQISAGCGSLDSPRVQRGEEEEIARRGGVGQRGGQSGRLQGEAVWGTLVGVCPGWGEKDPGEEAPISGHSSAGGGREKELFCSLNDFFPSFSA